MVDVCTSIFFCVKLRSAMKDRGLMAKASSTRRCLWTRLRGSTVGVWYRYPSDVHPRSITVRIETHASIADAVARSIARDASWEDILLSPTPTLSLLARLHAQPNADIQHALSYAGIQPPAYRPPSPTSSRKRPSRSSETSTRPGATKRVRRGEARAPAPSPPLA